MVLASAIVACDFNGDGKLDLAVVNSNMTNTPGTVSILLGNGDGAFQAPVTYAAGIGPTDLAAGDLTGNGVLDLVVSNATDAAGMYTVLIGNGDGTFQSAVSYSAMVGGNPILADFTNRGKLDLAFGACILPGHGDGTFGAPICTPAPGLYGTYTAAGDFNHDGNLDLAISGGNSATLGGVFIMLASISTRNSSVTQLACLAVR